MTRLPCLAAALLALASAPAAPAPRIKPAARAGPAEPGLRARIAALVRRRTEFGALSLIPVRFEGPRIAGPFEDGGRTTYCVTAQMYGRNFGRAERARAIVRASRGPEGTRLAAESYDAEVCAGQRTEPFPEFEAAGQ